MREKLLPSLINRPCGDPGMILYSLVEGYYLMFDLPDLHHVPTRILRKTRSVFVTHTHMDHFIGMGHFLRLNLTRDDLVVLCGPRGFIRNVEGFLASFTWNLGEEYPFSLEVREVDHASVMVTTYSCRRHFRRETYEELLMPDPLLRADRLDVRACTLDHGIPSLAFRVDEHNHININADRLQSAGMEKGPWLADLKNAIREAKPDDTLMATPVGPQTLGELKDRFVIITPGQTFGYVVDMAYRDTNLDILIPFIRGVDILYIESAFPESEEQRALERNHLTTRQAAEIAAAAGAHKLRPLHISPKYFGMEDEFCRELQKHFPGQVQYASPTVNRNNSV